MRSELADRLHFGPFGTQLHVLFQAEDADEIAKEINDNLRNNIKAHLHSLGKRTFVEVLLCCGACRTDTAFLPRA